MSINLTPTEKKVLRLALNDDDRVQTHYSKEVFNCHYLPDHIQYLRPKLGSLFDVEDGTEILATEYHSITKIDGKKSRIGIYRIDEIYKTKVKKLIDDVELSKDI